MTQGSSTVLIVSIGFAGLESPKAEDRPREIRCNDRECWIQQAYLSKFAVTWFFIFFGNGRADIRCLIVMHKLG